MNLHHCTATKTRSCSPDVHISSKRFRGCTNWSTAPERLNILSKQGIWICENENKERTVTNHKSITPLPSHTDPGKANNEISDSVPYECGQFPLLMIFNFELVFKNRQTIFYIRSIVEAWVALTPCWHPIHNRTGPLQLPIPWKERQWNKASVCGSVAWVVICQLVGTGCKGINFVGRQGISH